MADPSCGCGRQLPLTIPRIDAERQGVDEPIIKNIVDSFYDRIRADEMLGPVFNEVIDDWDEHLPKMYRFWSSVVLHTGTYSGRPLEAHLDLPGVTLAHFDRWLGLWEEVVRSHVPDEAAAVFTGMAMRMARTLSSRYQPKAG